jgi:hypothetical protein
VVDSGSAGSGNSGVQEALGQILLDLAREWQQGVQQRNLNTEAMGLMRDVYSALALQLAVRATELLSDASADAARVQLTQIQKELRSELANTVATIKR